LNTAQYDSAYIELLYSYRALAYGQSKLIVISVICNFEYLCRTDCIVVTEENKKVVSYSIPNSKFEISRRGICFAKAS
jgi:hypothetical protein